MANIVDTTSTRATSNSNNNCLYVGDLHPAVTELELYEEFSQIGTVVTINLCRANRVYAYIHFSNPDDAKRAIEELNYKPLNGVPMRIMWFDSNSDQRRSEVGNVFIKNLEKSINTITLYDTFSLFGNILSCKVALDSNGKSKGFGFIHFEEERCAEEAIKKVNGALLNNTKVYVGKFIPRIERREILGDRYNLFNNIYIKNLPKDYTEEDLKKLFKEVGQIISVKIVTDDSGISRRFGFVCFTEFTCAQTAVEQFHNREIRDTVLYVSRAQKKTERQENLYREYEQIKLKRRQCNLYIAFLHASVDDVILTTAFREFGTITSAKVMKKDNCSLGFGFVCYSSRQEAYAAIRGMNGKFLNSQKLYVSFTATKEERLREETLRELRTRNGYFTPQLNDGMPSSTMPVPALTHASNQPYYVHLPQVCNLYTKQKQNIAIANKNTRSATVESLKTAISKLTDFARIRQTIGDNLYQQIVQIEPALAGKITGMLIDLNRETIYDMLENVDLLKRKVEEAIEILKRYNNNL